MLHLIISILIYKIALFNWVFVQINHIKIGHSA